MTSLKLLFNRLLDNKIIGRIIMAVSLVGFADSVYLTVDHYFGIRVLCYLVHGCDVVLKSEYSQLFGVPLAIFGIIFYSCVFVIINLVDIYQKDKFVKLLYVIGIVGFIASIIFLYLQLFVIEALCFYCLVSLGSSTIIFILSILLYNRSTNIVP